MNLCKEIEKLQNQIGVANNLRFSVLTLKNHLKMFQNIRIRSCSYTPQRFYSHFFGLKWEDLISPEPQVYLLLNSVPFPPPILLGVASL